MVGTLIIFIRRVEFGEDTPLWNRFDNPKVQGYSVYIVFEYNSVFMRDYTYILVLVHCVNSS
jgi:hypothetical protein